MSEQTRRNVMKIAGSALGGIAVGSTVTAAERTDRYIVDTKRKASTRKLEQANSGTASSRTRGWVHTARSGPGGDGEAVRHRARQVGPTRGTPAVLAAVEADLSRSFMV